MSATSAACFSSAPSSAGPGGWLSRRDCSHSSANACVAVQVHDVWLVMVSSQHALACLSGWNHSLKASVSMMPTRGGWPNTLCASPSSWTFASRPTHQLDGVVAHGRRQQEGERGLGTEGIHFTFSVMQQAASRSPRGRHIRNTAPDPQDACLEEWVKAHTLTLTHLGVLLRASTWLQRGQGGSRGCRGPPSPPRPVLGQPDGEAAAA